VLKSFAQHYATGEVIPDSLIQKMQKALVFNQGYATTSQLGLAYVDLAWYTRKDPAQMDATVIEKETFDRLGKLDAVSVVRSVNSDHIFAGGYDAGYYAYTWAEVLDADAFEAFKEHGIFDPATAKSFHENVLSKGGTAEPMELYKRFRGAEPGVGPLLRRRGLAK
jgi:peptidyl-dipeptidase Dcp